MLVTLIIQQNNSHSIIDISKESKFNEGEFLFLPFSFFKITGVNEYYKIIYLTALNTEKPIEEMFLDFMEKEIDNLDFEGLDILQLTNEGKTLILNPRLKKETYDKNI